LVICLFAITISSCMWGKPTKKSPDIVKDTLAYKYTVFKERAADCGNKPDSDCTVAKFTFPDFKGQNKLNNTVTSKLLDMFRIGEKPDTSLASLTKNFMTDYISSKRGGASSMCYSLDAHIKVIRQDSSLTTLETGGYVFKGGAHPLSYTGFINWDTKTNKSITLTDLIDRNNLEKFNRIAEGIFRKNEKLTDTASLANDYFFKDNKFALSDNFAITPTGLKFLYNQYEIKPYAAGITTLVIPYSQIKNLLRPNTVITQYIK
jgi:hypothetical protein